MKKEPVQLEFDFDGSQERKRLQEELNKILNPNPWLLYNNSYYTITYSNTSTTGTTGTINYIW